MKQSNLMKAFADGGNSILMVSADDLRDFAKTLIEECKHEVLLSIKDKKKDAQPNMNDDKGNFNIKINTEYINIKEVQKIINRSKTTIERWSLDRGIEFHFLHGQRVFTQREFDSLIWADRNKRQREKENRK